MKNGEIKTRVRFFIRPKVKFYVMNEIPAIVQSSGVDGSIATDLHLI